MALIKILPGVFQTITFIIVLCGSVHIVVVATSTEGVASVAEITLPSNSVETKNPKPKRSLLNHGHYAAPSIHSNNHHGISLVNQYQFLGRLNHNHYSPAPVHPTSYGHNMNSHGGHGHANSHDSNRHGHHPPATMDYGTGMGHGEYGHNANSEGHHNSYLLEQVYELAEKAVTASRASQEISALHLRGHGHGHGHGHNGYGGSGSHGGHNGHGRGHGHNGYGGSGSHGGHNGHGYGHGHGSMGSGHGNLGHMDSYTVNEGHGHGHGHGGNSY